MNGANDYDRVNIQKTTKMKYFDYIGKITGSNSTNNSILNAEVLVP